MMIYAVLLNSDIFAKFERNKNDCWAIILCRVHPASPLPQIMCVLSICGTANCLLDANTNDKYWPN